ncbi:MAG: GNAT family N-acetyltransferase [Anaerolineae bacterium]|jgi:signal transduction histidine kinase/GNAT superfamily N-acetyltransferase|nr:GNAT family N-acetyltransferase [Anaerolineae bacterium]
MAGMRIEQPLSPNPEWENVVTKGLQAYNLQAVGYRDPEPLSLFVLDEHDAVVGGLLGMSQWGWLHIERLWLDESIRKQGYGEQLMQRAEDIGRERQCTHIILETFTFQALPFYQRLGFSIYGQLDNFPQGHSQYFLKKSLLPKQKDFAPTHTYHDDLYHVNLPDKTFTDKYLMALYQIILDLLNRHSRDDLLKQIVEDAALFLDAPYGEIMLLEGDELVVYAFTNNQPYLLGDRVKRGEGLATWRAIDTKQPVLIDDYSTWSGRRSLYEQSQLHAVLNLPILRGDKCIGALGMARLEPDYPFDEEDVQRGMQFAQLIAVVIDNVELYEKALQEIEEHKQAQAIIQFQNETLRQTNIALEEARKQADEANRVKSKFVANMSHELRTPLNAIMGFSQLYIEGLLGDVTDEQTKFMERIYSNSKQLLYLINQVLDFSKVESGFLEITPVEFNVAGLINDIFNETESLAIRKQLTYQIDLQPNMPPRVYGDFGRIKQVIINFISNAIKFTDSGQVILSCGASEDKMWYVCVSDTGIGISDDQMDTIFEEFRQTEKGRERGGTGLGLSIVKKLVTLMGGYVTVSSQVGKGSQFTVHLPIRYDPKQVNAPRP